MELVPNLLVLAHIMVAVYRKTNIILISLLCVKFKNISKTKKSQDIRTALSRVVYIHCTLSLEKQSNWLCSKSLSFYHYWNDLPIVF